MTARYRTPEVMPRLAPEHSPAWHSLAVSVLHVDVLGQLLPAATGSRPQCGYVHRVQEVHDAVAAKREAVLDLTTYREMYENGEITQSEYERIRNKIAEKMKREDGGRGARQCDPPAHAATRLPRRICLKSLCMAGQRSELL